MTTFTKSMISPAVLLLVGLTGLSVPAAAQQPSPAQISAVRSSCRADFMAHCSGVQPGGRDALVCLQKNIAALSTGCQQAVSAVAGAAPAGGAGPTTAAVPSGAATTAAAAPSAETSAGAAAPTATERAAPPATSRPGVGASSPAASSATLAPPPARFAPARPAVPPRVELALFGRACGGDVQVHCPGVRPGGGQILGCLAANQARLSPGCRQALAAARQSM